MKKLIIISLMLLFPIWALAAVDSHYVSESGNGAQDGTSAATAWSAADFETAGNWDVDVADDNKIGPGDTVYLLDDDGKFSGWLSCQGSGSSGNQIIITAGSGESVEMDKFTNNGNNYITFDGKAGGGTITLDDTTNDNNWYGTVDIDGDYCIVQNLTIQNSQSEWIRTTPTADHCEVYDNIISGCWGSGEIKGTYHIVKRNDFSDPKATVDTHTGGDPNFVYFHGNNHLFADNYIHDYVHVGDEHMDAFQTYDAGSGGEVSGNNCIFEHNRIFLGNTSSKTLEEAASDTATVYGWMLAGSAVDKCNNITIRNNIVEAWGGINTGGGNVSNLRVYNNTFRSNIDFNPAYWGSAIGLENVATADIKNNIIVDFPYAHVYIEGGSGITADYNCKYNSDASNPGGQGEQAHDVWKQNPLFNDGSFLGDYWLESDSPCIDVGVDVGDTPDADNDQGLNSSSSWPSSVLMLDQDLYGTGWEIGAYVYESTERRSIIILSELKNEEIIEFILYHYPFVGSFWFGIL